MNISLEGVHELSYKLSEPDWLRNNRAEAFRISERLPLPESRHTRIKGLTFASLNPEPDGAGKGIDLYRTDGPFQFLQINSRVIKVPDESSLKQTGVIITDMNTASKKYPEIVREFFINLTTDETQDKFESLLRAFFSGGILIYVPKNVQMNEPIYSSFIISGSGTAMFVPVVIIAEEGSSLKVIDNYSSSDVINSPSLIVSSVFAFVKDSAKIDYISTKNFDKNIFSFSTLRSFLNRDSHIDWRVGWFGARLGIGRLFNYLKGEGADFNEAQVFFLNGKEHLHISSNIFHQCRHTTAKVLIKGALRDNARSVFYGNVKIEKDAQDADSFLSDHVMLLNSGARADSIPGLEIKANQVRASHSASIGQIDEEQVFYLMTRGLPEHDAKRSIVSGFLSPVIESIPHEQLKEQVWESFHRKWMEA
jgi:Fe-S cluster assembly protein SufD